MAIEVPRTTAEHVIAATDAALQLTGGVTRDVVANFVDIPAQNAENALEMAAQLGLLKKSGKKFSSEFPYAPYLVTSDKSERAAMLRFVLELYEPYKTFRSRLELERSAEQAATETKAIHSISTHRDDIQNTFTNIGTYADSLVWEAAGKITPRRVEEASYITTVGEIVQNRADAETEVRLRIGEEAAGWVDTDEVFNHLVTAYQRLGAADVDAKAPVTHAANAIESFLVQVADDQGVDITSAKGINTKAQRLKGANKITAKHLGILEYLGHVRNAAGHGADPDLGVSWTLTAEAAIEYVYVAQTAVRSCVAYLTNGSCVI